MKFRLPLMLALMLIPLSTARAADLVETRAAWEHPQEYDTKAAADATLAKAQRAHLNVLVPLVKHLGRVHYRKTTYLPVDSKVEEGFDPLACLVEGAHARGIEVHAWFVNAMVGYSLAGRPEFYKGHPDWFLTDYFGQRSSGWLDFGQKAVRDQEAAIMVDVVRNYPELDGIHFDYIRHPGGTGDRFCFCDECRRGFKDIAGVDPKICF
jgi:uncharacterized lipoprotein YddW (UPF0748 family)